ncbi:hypothetical protein AYO44_16745 [Planctomycetaceae bacterium SCGC AG-212-F19]|nr:hypothetical protein AYO44_16745 [Planctomycetaceae bacterium SCGC AG-212-F19]
MPFEHAQFRSQYAQPEKDAAEGTTFDCLEPQASNSVEDSESQSKRRPRQVHQKRGIHLSHDLNDVETFNASLAIVSQKFHPPRCFGRDLQANSERASAQRTRKLEFPATYLPHGRRGLIDPFTLIASD